MKLLKLLYKSIQKDYLQQLINNAKRIASISNYSFVLWKPETLLSNAFQEQSLRLLYKMWCFVVFGVSKIFYRSWDILQNISKFIEKHMSKHLLLVTFVVYVIEGLFRFNSVRDIFKEPFWRILLKVSKHLFSMRLLVVASIYQDCLNVDDTVRQVKKCNKKTVELPHFSIN